MKKITIPVELFPAPILMPISRNHWVVSKNYKAGCDYMGEQVRISIPAGFVSDLDSVPRIPVFYEVFKGRTRTAALIHDFLYRSKFKRSVADDLFLGFMIAEGVRRRYAIPIFYAVRTFGWIWYKK
jgi:hypothetical protein